MSPVTLNQAGIYKITNTAKGKIYIGSSVNIASRWSKHLSSLRLGTHKNGHLQAAFNQDGEGAFRIEVLEVCDKGRLLEREQYHLDTNRPEYNILPIAGNSMGYRHDEVAKQKMSQANMGNKRFLGKSHSPETRKKLAAARLGTTLSAAHVARIKEANRGNTHTLGHKLTDEHKAKVAAASSKMWEDPARRAKRSEDTKARWADPEWKAQQGARIAQGKAAKRAAAAHGIS